MNNLNREPDPITGFDFRCDTPLRPLKAIRKHCIACQGGIPSRVTDCQITGCHLWPYRHGKRPVTIADSKKNHNGRCASLHNSKEMDSKPGETA